MGLYAIPIRDQVDTADIPGVLERHGYVVTFDRETDAARFFICDGVRRPLHFWISKGSPQRFSIGVGKEGDEIVKLLSDHGVFGDIDETNAT